jgi:hypothetical protein
VSIYEDAPPAYRCAACDDHGMTLAEKPYGNKVRCVGCDEWYCLPCMEKCGCGQPICAGCLDAGAGCQADGCDAMAARIDAND